MQQINYNALVLLLIFIGAVVLFFRPWMLDVLIETLNNFRGGPPTPMHPSPADDSALLRKRLRKSND